MLEMGAEIKASQGERLNFEETMSQNKLGNINIFL